VQFAAVTVTRSYEQVAQQIEAQIRGAELVRGQKLPTEREMGEQFGVSRGVVREAIKVLSAMGLVESRQGSGIFVRNNPIPSISQALTLSVTPETASVQRLLEFRESLEALAAHYTALRRTDAQLAEIQALMADNARSMATNDWHLFSETDQSLHLAIAGAADNPYLYAVLSATRQMQRDVMRLLARRSGVLAVAVGHHTRIVAAIAAGDAIAATEAMREHMQYSSSGAQRVLEEAGREDGGSDS
jgi:GntR family transcriptional repressor for pyruvate dehydrogenase complex